MTKYLPPLFSPQGSPRLERLRSKAVETSYIHYTQYSKQLKCPNIRKSTTNKLTLEQVSKIIGMSIVALLHIKCLLKLYFS